MGRGHYQQTASAQRATISRRSLLALGSAGGVTLVTKSVIAQPPPRWHLPLRVTVARVEGRPVIDPEWMDSQTVQANTIFAPSGVSFEIAARDTMPATHAALETRADRHALGELVRPAHINVFVVASLRDVDDPSRMRQGVHWRPRGNYPPGTHLVIVTAHAGPTVLAHELGHFFGNRRHPETAGNIMSYNRGEQPPFFDEDQLRTIRRFARRFIRTGELRPLHIP